MRSVNRWYRSRQTMVPRPAEVLLLGGGRGSRLRGSSDPRLRTTAKLLVPVGNRHGQVAPMITHILHDLSENGFQDVSLLTSDDADACAEEVEKYVAETFASLAGLRAFRETNRLGTAGAVYAALQHVTAADVIVVPGDTLFPFAKLGAALARHRTSASTITWVVTTQPGENAQNAGALSVDGTGRKLLAANESQPDQAWARLGTRATSVGVVIVSRRPYRRMFRRYAAATRNLASVDLHRDLIPWALQQGVQVGAYDVEQAAPDLGTPDRLFRFGGWSPYEGLDTPSAPAR